MASITETAVSAILGNPPDPNKEPDHVGTVTAFMQADAAISSLALAFAAGTPVAYSTRALLLADLAQGANTLGVVYNDPTAAYNGFYIKSGGSGSGTWTITALSIASTFAATLASKQDNFANLDEFGALTLTASKYLHTNGSGDLVLDDLNAYGEKFMAWSGAINTFPYVTSGNALAAAAITSAGRTLVASADKPAMQTYLEIDLKADAAATTAALATKATTSALTSGLAAKADAASTTAALATKADASTVTAALAGKADAAATTAALATKADDIATTAALAAKADGAATTAALASKATNDAVALKADAAATTAALATKADAAATTAALATKANSADVNDALDAMNGVAGRVTELEGFAGSAQSNSFRPGDAPYFFSHTSTGLAVSRQPLAIGSRDASDAYGGGWLVPGALIPADPGYLDVWTRYDIPLDQATDKFNILVIVERKTAPVDPGNGVQVRIQNLNKNAAHISNIQQGSNYLLPNALDAFTLENFIVSRTAGDDIDYVVPATTRYIAVGVRIFKTTGDTLVVANSAVNVTQSIALSGDVAQVAADLAAETAARIAADAVLNDSITTLGTGKEDKANKGVASGYASLDGNIKVPIAQLPATQESVGAGSADTLILRDAQGLVPVSNIRRGATYDKSTQRSASDLTAVYDLDTIAADYRFITNGGVVTNVTEFILKDDKVRMVYASKDFTITVSNWIIGDDGANNLSIKAGDWFYVRGEGSYDDGGTPRDKVRILVFQKATSVGGAANANRRVKTDINGLLTRSLMPLPFQFGEDDGGPAWSLGDGTSTYFWIDANGQPRSDFMDALVTKLMPFVVRALGTGGDEGPGFSLGDDKSAIAAIDPVTGRIISTWLDYIAQLASSTALSPLVYLHGDSRADLCSDPGRTRAQGWLWWLEFLTGCRFVFFPAYNFGTGGDDSRQFREKAGLLAVMPPGHAIAPIGTNDRTGTGQTAEWTIAYQSAAQDGILACGHQLTWIVDTPRGDNNGKANSAGLSATQVLRQNTHRNWQLRQPQLKRGVHAADAGKYLTDPASATFFAKDNMLRDGLHWGAAGALYVALPLVFQFLQMYPPVDILPVSNSDLYDATNNKNGSLIANSMLLGTGGTLGTGCTLDPGPNGGLAASWGAWAGAGLAGVLSKVTDTDGEWQRVVVSGGCTNNGVTKTTKALLDADLAYDAFTVATVTADANPALNGNYIKVGASGTGSWVICLDTLVPYPTSVNIYQDIDVAKLSPGDVIQTVGQARLASGHSGVRGMALYLTLVTATQAYTYASGEPDTTRSSTQTNLNFVDDAIMPIKGIWRVPTSDNIGTVIAARVQVVISGAQFLSTAVAISATVDFRAVKPFKYGV